VRREAVSKAKKKNTTSSESEKANITRVKATEVKPVKKDKKAVAKTTTVKKEETKPGLGKRFIGYFKGAWYELKQVRWPTRKATWGLTLAVILFTAFFVVIILFLDYVFQQLFDLIIR
jgi:preprotein translocase subunit SecE